MFIPRGNALHENMATSYVLLDSLVEYLCADGFSGIVEILLQSGECHIIIDQGKVAAVLEQQENQPLSHTTVPLIAARSRAELGRVSVYSYTAGTALALAGRITAEPLYKGLSTDFADLDRMLAKLSRERDRQWFIEVNTASDVAALIHLDGDVCRVITGNGAEEDEVSALRRMIDECNRAGARFDVLFKRAAPEEPVDLIAARDEPGEAEAEPADQEITIEENIIAAPVENEPPPEFPVFAETDSVTEQTVEPDLSSLLPHALSYEEEPYEQPDSSPDELDAPDHPPDALMKGLSPNTIRLFAMPSMTAEPEEQASGPDAMIELKKLMGEITRSIEEAARTAEPQSKFSMYLRAGQLKIADRFPFLDPFGAEFEYLGGEIAFIGDATPEEFIKGLTEALKLAVVGLAQSSAQPARLRKQIAEDLRRLQSRIGPDLERYGLEHSIEQILRV